MHRALLVQTLALTLASAPAMAGVILVDGGVQLTSTSLDGPWGGSAPWFTNTSLTSLHLALAADGIDTDGHVTFLALDTDLGLSFVTLVDGQFGGGSGSPDAGLAMSTTGPGSSTWLVNDYGQDITTIIDPPWGSTTAAGSFLWDSAGEGDGFAWASLVVGDTFTFAFGDTTGDTGGLPTFPALDGVDTFQFVSWSISGWSVAASEDFKDSGLFAFGGEIIPAPGSLALLAGAFLLTRRRRRA